MRHSHRVEGHGFDLRPVEPADAELIVELRTSDPQRVRYLHPVPPDVQQQREWLSHYFRRAGDYYWVVERRSTGEAEGLVGIYDVDEARRTAEWGRWLLKPGSLGATESALLVYRAAFEILGLDTLYCITVADNGAVLSFHDSCGLQRGVVLKDRFELLDGRHDGVVHTCERAQWPALRDNLEGQARLIADRWLRHR